MADTNWPSIVEVTSRLEPDGSIAMVAEWLAELNPILNDVPWVEGNLPGGHRFTARDALPTVTWRRLNQGVLGSFSTASPHEESCGMLEAFSYIDKDLAELNGNSAAWRASEDKAFVEALNQEWARALFYESVANNAERIHGLIPRLNDGTVAPYNTQMINADPYDSGTAAGTEQHEFWLIGWSPDKVFGIYPKGSIGGLKTKDLGLQLLSDHADNAPEVSTARLLAYVTHFQWKVGLCVRDYRYLVRGVNIDTSLVTSGQRWASDGKVIQNMMTEALTRIFSLEGCRPVFYMNRTLFSKLNQQLQNNSANFLEWVDKGGRLIPHFLGVPISVNDVLVVGDPVAFT